MIAAICTQEDHLLLILYLLFVVFVRIFRALFTTDLSQIDLFKIDDKVTAVEYFVITLAR